METKFSRVRAAMREMPLVAILRGLAPERAQATAQILIDAGFRLIEVPLNGAGAIKAIAAIKSAVPQHIVVGAGTVLTPNDAREAVNAGAELLVMPNTDVRVMAEGRSLGVALMPGFLTPSEAFVALECGALALKLFPAEIAGPQGLKALRSVVPKTMAPIYAVGGVTPESLGAWRDAGADGVGTGGTLFKPEFDEREIETRARAFVRAWRALNQQGET
ncbi:MAG: 2-dehydro-3-deoxy-6-phosphogalactonate aldolase [Alphaproteobacteria bacterium]|nr:2-dehydro-3-deoxy-6-phosphogalactonate aldolase [Alphaproteobacteria bacterium]